MKRDKLPIYFNLPIDASIANFSVNYTDIICLNTTKITSTYKLFKIIESTNTSNISTPTKLTEPISTTTIEKSEISEQKSEAVNLIEKYKNVISETENNTSTPPNPTLQSNDIKIKSSETSKSTPIQTSSTKKIIEPNEQVRKTYELYDKMFKEGTFGKVAVPEAPAKDINSTELEVPKIKTGDSDLDARATFEMYEKMFADGTFDEKAKTIETQKPEEPTEEKSEARATFEMYEKMFADGTFDEKAKTKPEEPTEEKSEAKATFEMYEKMFADGTFDEKAKTVETQKVEEPTEEKSEAKATFEMYEKMFADGTFDEKAKTVETQKVEEPTEEKSEAKATFEMYEKMFADGTFDEKLKATEPVEEKLDDKVNLEQFEKISTTNVITTFVEDKTTEDIPKLQNIFEMIPNPLDQIQVNEVNNLTNDNEKVETKETFEQLEKIFNEGTFENLENFKSAEFPKEIFGEDTSASALEKINNFFTNSGTDNDDSEHKIVDSTKTNFWSIYNLADKNENEAFFLKFDRDSQTLIEFNDEHDDNIFKLKKVSDDTYQFEMIESDVNHPFFTKNINLVLDLCEVLNTRHGTHTRVKTIRTGKLVKNENIWTVKDKAKGMYQ
jgi:hypothetical protein